MCELNMKKVKKKTLKIESGDKVLLNKEVNIV